MKHIIKSLGKGILKVIDSGLLGGVIHNYKEESEIAPKGSIDVKRLVRELITSTVPYIYIIIELLIKYGVI
jgi:hypothetical protein